jgi:quercetin dioxygenase-like cupin family protein
MKRVNLSEGFYDARGVIQDLIEGPVDAVTLIHTAAGAVRGNHVHKRTTQWTYVLTGRLLMSNGHEDVVKPGQMVVHHPNEPHAWKALEHTDCLVFTKGPRAGENYESDTYRLNEPLLS